MSNLVISEKLRKLLGSGRLALQVTALGTGGTERYVQDLAVSYQKLGLNPLVIVDNKPLDRLDSLKSAGVQVEILDISEKASKRQYFKELQNVLKTENVALLHCNAWRRWNWILNCCINTNTRFIKTMHSTTIYNLRRLVGFTWPQNWYRIWRDRLIATSKKPAIISISELSCQGLRKFWGKNIMTKTVHLGVPATFREPCSVGQNHNAVFVWIGSFTRRKRPLLMLEAYEAVIQDFPEANLIMVGDGPLRNKVEEYAKNKITGEVHFTGFIKNVEEILLQSNIFVLTSRNEGFPYVNIEAMAAGLPVITTNCGAVVEGVTHGKTGFVVPLNDKVSLSEAMKKLAGNPNLRKEMGKVGYERWKRLFSLEKMVENTLGMYLSLLSNNFNGN